MAYFSNGAEGEVLEDQCIGCLHGEDLTIFCPISAVQTNFNYRQADKGQGALRQALNMLIDQDGICQMKPLIDKIKGGN